MYKNFLKPIWKIIVVYAIGGLGIASDVAQLTSFNILDFLKSHLPQSFYFLLIGTLLLYLVLVIIEFNRKKTTQHYPSSESKAEQFIGTGNIKNSTIIQIKRDKGD